MKGMEHSAYVKTLDAFSLLQIEMLLLILQMLKNGQVCPSFFPPYWLYLLLCA